MGARAHSRLDAVDPVRPAAAYMMRDRHRTGQRQLARIVRSGRGAVHHRPDLLARKPARLRQLLGIDGDLLRLGLAQEAHHQAGWERPGLAGEITHPADADAGFLMHLAPHALLKRLARLHETGQARETVAGTSAVAAEQGPV